MVGILSLPDSSIGRGWSTSAEEQFFVLLKREQGKLYRTALAILGNEADARDAVQETVIRGFRAFGQLRGGAATFPAWIRRILVNQATQILRHRARVVPVESPEALLPEAIEDGQTPDHSDVWEAVRHLDPRYRTVVALRFLNDMQLEDIAQALAIPVGTVKSRLHAAMKQLRRRLAQADPPAGAEQPRGRRAP